jgi:hypothetical protein
MTDRTSACLPVRRDAVDQGLVVAVWTTAPRSSDCGVRFGVVRQAIEEYPT